MKRAQFIDWLFNEDRFNTDFDSFNNSVCKKLVEYGIPITRVRISFRALHPQVMGWSCVWDKENRAQVHEINKQILETGDYINSPIEYVLEKKKPFRQSLLELPTDAHSVLFELREQGLTDYFACPIEFSNNVINISTYATDCPNGFSKNCINIL